MTLHDPFGVLDPDWSPSAQRREARIWRLIFSICGIAVFALFILAWRAGV